MTVLCLSPRLVEVLDKIVLHHQCVLGGNTHDGNIFFYYCPGVLRGNTYDGYILTNVKSSKELWDSLEAKYMVKDASSKKFLEELTLVELGSHLCIEESLRMQDSDKPKGNTVVDPLVVNMVEHNNSSRMIMLRAFMSTSKLNDSILWHARLGHVHFKRMQDMSKDGLISTFDMDTGKYKTCILTKITKKVFQNVKSETEVLELIHSDLCDLHATPLLENKKYFVTFIDNASKFCYVYLLHTKDEALDIFKVFKTEVELQQGSLIKKDSVLIRGDTIMSDSEDSTVTYTAVSCPFKDGSDIDSPGYVPEADPKEEPEEDDEDPKEDPTDYPADRDDDDEEEEEEPFRDDVDDEDKDEDEDEEEEEEHPAPVDSVPPVHRMTARISIRDEPSISLPPREKVERLLALTTPPPSPLTPLSSPLPQIPSPPLPAFTTSICITCIITFVLSSDRRTDRPEITLPPRKRLGIDLGPRYEIGESLAASATRPIGCHPREAVEELAPITLEEVNTRVTELAVVQEQDTQDIYAYHYETARLLNQEALVSKKEWGRSIEAVISQLQAANRATYVDFDIDAVTRGIGDHLTGTARNAARNCDGSHTSGTSVRRTERVAREIETVFCISNCFVDNQIKFSTCTLLAGALTWWNSHVRIVQGTRCQSSRVFPEEADKVERYVGGLPDMIQGSVVASKPKTIQEATEMASKLMDKKINAIAKRQAKNKREVTMTRDRMEGLNLYVLSETTIMTVPVHQGVITARRLAIWPETVGGGLQLLTTIATTATITTEEPKGKIPMELLAMCVEPLGVAGQNPNNNVVTGTFLLNNRYASILFDTGADKSFVSTAFSTLIDIIPTTLDHGYDVELADGRIIRVNTILQGCTMNFLNHPFHIDLMPVEMGSFDVIISMDWLTKYHAIIDCAKKIVRIPFRNEILIIQDDRSGNVGP
ncbi:putative reverse transcriptase domain-containing protein [Tanacetum coccineum]